MVCIFIFHCVTEIGNNGYAKFWRLMNEMYYGQCENGEKALGSRASDVHIITHKWPRNDHILD